MSAHLVEIFRAGTRTTGLGEMLAFSETDLSLTAAAYAAERKPAPLVLGHPANDAPAMGDTLRLDAKGANLYAIVRPTPALASLVRAGNYKKISAAFYRPSEPGNPVPGVWYLRHIGFLGSTTPAVKGMASPAFSEASALDVCFAEAVEIEFPQLSVALGHVFDPARLAIHRTALRFQQTNQSLSYAEAVAFAERIS